MDLNHDKQIQSLLCYRYTIGQDGVSKLDASHGESRFVKPLNRWIVESGGAIGRKPDSLPRFNNSTIQRFNGSTIQRFNGSTIHRSPRP